MEKAKILFFCFRKTCPILPRGLQKLECSFNVGADKFLRVVDGPVYMAFRSKMNDCRRLVDLQQMAYQVGIIDISAREHVTMVIAKISQVGGIPCVCELIKVHYSRALLCQPMQDEVGAYKTGPARHQNRL